MNGIPIYKEINDLHRLTGSQLRSSHPEFHCFDMAEANDLKVSALPPHRVEFYTLALNFGTENLDYTLNTTSFHRPKHFILCVAPGQVAKWEKNGRWLGYCSFFKSAFLHLHSGINFLQDYPFFNIHEANLLPVNEENFKTLSLYFKQIITEQEKASNFSLEIIRSSFQAILWIVRRIYEESKGISVEQNAQAVISSQFQYLVNEYFKEKISVEEYARMLNISANHLSQTVKKASGRTAKSFITQRRLEEAKYLLRYTGNSVLEIAFYLHFSEATYFSKLFKKETGLTPLAYRAG